MKWLLNAQLIIWQVHGKLRNVVKKVVELWDEEEAKEDSRGVGPLHRANRRMEADEQARIARAAQDAAH